MSFSDVSLHALSLLGSLGFEVPTPLRWLGAPLKEVERIGGQREYVRRQMAEDG